MRIIEWEKFTEEGLPIASGFSAVTIGVFDGVHRGHKTLIERVTNYGKGGAAPVIVTFIKNHKTASESQNAQNITSFRQKCEIFKSLGVEVTIAVDFSDSFRQMSGADFFRLLWNSGKMGFLAVGSNFRCGCGLDTDADLICKLNGERGIPVEVVEPLTQDGQPVSSSRIRGAIREGKLQEAASMLGRPFVIDTKGANIAPLENSDGGPCRITNLQSVLPPSGQYAVLLRKEGGGARQADIHIKESAIEIPSGVFDRACQNVFVEFIG